MNARFLEPGCPLRLTRRDRVAAEHLVKSVGKMDSSHRTYARRSRSALKTTDTELRLMATAANIGESNTPKAGYRMPAAIGTPKAL